MPEVDLDHQVGAARQHGQIWFLGECLNRLREIDGADDVHRGLLDGKAVAAAMAGIRA